MKLEKSYNTKQYFHSFYRQNHALLVLSFLFTVICFPANLIGSWLLGQVIDAITEVSMNRLRAFSAVSKMSRSLLGCKLLGLAKRELFE